MSSPIDAPAIGRALWGRALPEERVLFCCMRQDLDAPWRARLAAEGAGAAIEWDAVLRIAVRHQVAPLVLTNLARCDDVFAHVPAAVRAQFHHEMLGNLSAKAAMRRALTDALAFFASERIDVMAVKGTSFDLGRFADPAATTSGDIDLLLRQDWADVGEHVHARVAALNAGTPVVDVDFAKHPDLVLDGVLPIDFARIWSQARRIEVDGWPVFLMGTEHEVVCTAVNAARKRYFRLKSLFEISELLRAQPRLDWDEVLRCARAWRCAGILHTALLASAAAVGAPVPAGLLSTRGPGPRLGVGGAQGRLIAALVRRMSFCRLATLQAGWNIGGKRVGRGLWLPYVSLGLRGATRALARALAQAWRRRSPSPPRRP